MISWQQIYKGTHNYRQGAVNIAQGFTGNVLSVKVGTKPEYENNNQIIGWLYQYSGLAKKRFLLLSGNEVICLAIPETDSLEFIPTPYLNELFDLEINVANINVSNSDNVSGSIPIELLALPDTVLSLQAFTNALNANIAALSTRLDNYAPTWAAISGKPSSFSPSTHAHEITDVIGLTNALNGKANSVHSHSIGDISGLQTVITGLQSTDTTNYQAIVNLQSSDSSQNSSISSLQSNVATNTSALSSVVSRVGNLEASISVSYPKKIKISGNGDRGLFWYLGTLGTDENFIDPITRGSVFGLMSSAFGGTVINGLVDRVSLVTATNSEPNSWFGFDLGTDKSILIDRYYLRANLDNRYSVYPQKWVLEGTNYVASNTVSGFNTATWTEIDSRSNASVLNGLGFEGSFLTRKDIYFRFIRLRLTDGDNSGNYNFVLSAVELFGVLKVAS